MRTLNQKITATANHSQRTFTLRTYVNGKFSTKYRTVQLPKDEFESYLYATENDWRQFLKSSDYYRV